MRTQESGPEYRNSLNEMEHSVAELARVEFEVGHMDRALENVEQELAASDSQEQVRLAQTNTVIILKVAHLLPRWCEGAAQLRRRV